MIWRRRHHTPDDIKRIVITSTRWIGDAVMSVPALREMRRLFPHAHITLAAGAWARDVFAEADFFDELLCLDMAEASTLKRVWRQSRILCGDDARYDLAIVLQNSFASAVVPFLARVRRRAGYATDGRRAILTHPIAVPAWRSDRHEVFYYLNLVRNIAHGLNVAVDFDAAPPPIELRVSGLRQLAAREILMRHEADTSRRIVVICPGSTNSRAKRWGAGSYAELADCLVREANAEVVFIGAKQETDVTRTVVERMRERAIALTGQTTLAETVAVLSIADLMISNDTGPAHIAAGLARPTIVIFGSTNPKTTAPFSILAEVIREPPACAPCMLRDCPIDHRCMTAITVERVFERAMRMLKQSSANALGESIEISNVND